MTWTEAKEGTIRQWMAIRNAIGEADVVALLTEINAICDLCEKSEDEAGTGLGRCEYCLFYRQFGGCQEISGRISEKVAERDWPAVHALVDEMIRQLEEVRIPPERLRLVALAG